MKLVLLSDLHLTAGKPLHGRVPLACLRGAMNHIREHHADADLCMMLGDLAENGEDEQYRALLDAIETFPIPCRLTIGNHDNRENFLRVFGKEHADRTGFVQSRVDIGGYRCVLIDTNASDAHVGTLDRERLDRLAAVLAETDRPCLLFLHHPPIRTGLPAFDRIGLEDLPAFAALIGAHRDVVAGLFFGHCHMSVCGTVAGIPAFGIRSLVHQSLQHFADARFLTAPGLPPAYGVVLADDEGLIVHTVEFGYDGPIIATH